jgi:hypothetical protein
VKRLELAEAYAERGREAQRAGRYRLAADLFAQALTLLAAPLEREGLESSPESAASSSEASEGMGNS